jgi:hypothetical protein
MTTSVFSVTAQCSLVKFIDLSVVVTAFIRAVSPDRHGDGGSKHLLTSVTYELHCAMSQETDILM